MRAAELWAAFNKYDKNKSGELVANPNPNPNPNQP